MFCPHCGAANADGSSFCAKCGKSVTAAADQARWAPSQAARNADDVAVAGSGSIQYGGFWRRVAAAIIDGLILWVGQMALSLVFGLGIVASASLGQPGAAIGSILLVLVLTWSMQWLYFAFFESSSKQATPGKMALGMRVTDLYGNRIGFGRATGRHFGKIVSSLIMGIGYMMAGFTERKQALHDMMAGTLVVLGASAAPPQQLAGGSGSSGQTTASGATPLPPTQRRGMPGWAIALIVVAAMLVPLGILAAIAIPAYQDYTIRAQVTEGLAMASALKAPIAERIGESTQPVSEVMGSLSLKEQSGQYVQSVAIEQGALVVTYGNQANPRIAGETLALVPERGANGIVLWLCGHQASAGNGDGDYVDQESLTTIPNKYLPASCRGSP